MSENFYHFLVYSLWRVFATVNLQLTLLQKVSLFNFQITTHFYKSVSQKQENIIWNIIFILFILLIQVKLFAAFSKIS